MIGLHRAGNVMWSVSQWRGCFFFDRFQKASRWFADSSVFHTPMYSNQTYSSRLSFESGTLPPLSPTLYNGRSPSGFESAFRPSSPSQCVCTREGEPSFSVNIVFLNSLSRFSEKRPFQCFFCWRRKRLIKSSHSMKDKVK